MSLDERLRRHTLRGELRRDEPLARHTTLRVGGVADWFAVPADLADLQAMRRAATEAGLPCWCLGGGTNLLVLDGGVRGIVISLEQLRATERVDHTTVRAEAGVVMSKLLATCTEWGLGGLEFLAGVPGTLGGGLTMNAGTTLGELKDVVRQVRSIDASGALVTRRGDQCGFVYRGSAFPPDEVIVDAFFELQQRVRADIESTMRELRERRRGREPRGVGSAGSFFKNPPGDFAGRLIEAAGLKGRRVGAAEVSPVHANWLVNVGGATARDFVELIQLVRTEVEQRFNVRLELEVRVVGEPGPAGDSA